VGKNLKNKAGDETNGEMRTPLLNDIKLQSQISNFH
jgi:hypothetical protein